jgi:hypothetical protein
MEFTAMGTYLPVSMSMKPFGGFHVCFEAAAGSKTSLSLACVSSLSRSAVEDTIVIGIHEPSKEE